MVDVTIVVILLVSMVICHQVARQRGRNTLFWGCMGLTFGPLAIPALFCTKKRVVE